jgi:cAMP-dependent protein kinase regulator
MDPKRLEGIPLFAALSKKDRQQLSHHLDELIVQPGDHLVDQGRLAHEFFVIEEGTADVTRDGEQLAELGPGDFFGEMALVGDARRNASVTATTPMRVIIMHERDFRNMREDMPDVADKIQAEIEKRKVG